MRELSRIMNELGQPAGEDVVRKIVKSAGYRWRKHVWFVTSNDPEFSEKSPPIPSVLSNLQADEAFFSIDEFGPFSIKHHIGDHLFLQASSRLFSSGKSRVGA